MLRIRLKMGPREQLQRNKEWTCCFGLHVHTATIMIGLWHLFLNILALSLLAVITRDPKMMEELQTNYDVNDFNVDLNAPALPTPLSKVDPPYAYRDHSIIYRKQYHNYDMGGLVCACMIAITMMMIYGAIKGKPSHLLPFFCLQLFDFAITTLTAAGYLCYLQTIHRLIDESHRLPWREKLLELSPDELVVVVLIVFVCIVSLKAYAIGIVWRCYKYLTLRQQSMRSLLPLGIPDLNNTNLDGEERSYTTLLPNYDEAVAQYLKQAPPPSYQVAMSSYQNQQQPIPSSVSLNGNVILDLPGSVMRANTDEGNNNDTSNNNNTVHFNANGNANATFTANTNANDNDSAVANVDTNLNSSIERGIEEQRAEATNTLAAEGIPEDIQDNENAIGVPPPAYNEVVEEAETVVISKGKVNEVDASVSPSKPNTPNVAEMQPQIDNNNNKNTNEQQN